MSIEFSITIQYQCDECRCYQYYDADEPMTYEEVREHIESEGWEFRNGKLYCEDCKQQTKIESEFVERCWRCIRKLNKGMAEELYCPHYKTDCESVRDELQFKCGDFEHTPKCPAFQPLEGTEEKQPKYKPTDACLDRFVSGVE